MIVSTKYGNIQGIKMDGYTVYRGVPYAKPPVGEYRFKRPQKMDAWEDVLMADTFQKKCTQDKSEKGSFYEKEFYSNPEFMVESDEDCLYLNIWVPDKNTEEPFPVAVYIHGGAFMKGAGSNLPFDGEAYAERGVILVTINYRLGVFGFLCHPLLLEEDACGNYGIWDQIAALKWVQENISCFGGNHNKVTVFGQSAGAMSIETLIATPYTKGLFHRAIMQSGGGYKNMLMNDLLTSESMYIIGDTVLGSLGISPSVWKNSEEDKKKALERLYSCTSLELLAGGRLAVEKARADRIGIPFVPVIDHKLFTESNSMTIEQGNHHPIPYILGSNSEDIAINPEDLGKMEKNPLHRANEEFARLNERHHKEAAYIYYFRHSLPGDESGAFHSAELWYIFGTLKYAWRPFTKADKQLSEQLIKYWCNFIKNGNPNGENLTEWLPYTAEKAFVKEFT